MRMKPIIGTVAAAASLIAVVASAQPKVTAAQLAGLTPVALSNAPSAYNYLLLNGPAPDWPPLPAPPVALPGDTPCYVLGPDLCVLDCSGFDWGLESALTDLEVQYGLRPALTAGVLRPMDLNTYTSDDLYLLNPVVTNNTAWLTLHAPATELANGSAVYDLYYTTSLSPEGEGLNLTNWAWLLRTAPPGQTNVLVTDLWANLVFFRLGRTNSTAGDLVSDAFKQLVLHIATNTPVGPAIVSQPLSQTIYARDTVTFTVIAEGPPCLTYQWMFNGANISGETAASLTLMNAQEGQAGDYSVQVSSPAGLSTLSSNATLTVWDSSGLDFIPVTGPRQDFTFKRAATYLIYSPVQLYGRTVIQGGSVIKFDTTTNSSLQVTGTLTTDATAYYPGILTCLDDDSSGYLTSGAAVPHP